MGRYRLPPHLLKSKVISIRVSERTLERLKKVKGEYVGRGKAFKHMDELLNHLLDLFEKERAPKIRLE